MMKFKFDGAEYDLEMLPKEASGHVHAIQFIQAELHKHNMERASLKTAL